MISIEDVMTLGATRGPRAVFDTLAKGGDVVVTDQETLALESGIAAILRY